MRNGFTTAYVLVRGGEAAIVGTGVAGSAQCIGEVVQEAGLGWDAVKHVILTHYHGDHAGSIGDVLGLAQAATPWAGAEDIPRLRVPREIQPTADGAEIFRLQIIGTPGHTAGHISVFDPVGSGLILGDAAINAGGNLTLASPQNTADMDAAKESVRKIAGLTFETAWFMHGQPIECGASGAFQQLAARLDLSGGLAHAPDGGHDHQCT
jgi:glyoxylase-like metal-dependent hydrolase (beta-lactamase superfamily II)